MAGPPQEGDTANQGALTFHNGNWYNTPGFQGAQALGKAPQATGGDAGPALANDPWITMEDVKNTAPGALKAGALGAATAYPTMVDLGVSALNKIAPPPELTPEQRAKVFSPEGLGHKFPEWFGEKAGRPIQNFVQRLADPTKPVLGSYSDIADRIGLEDPEAKTPGGRLVQKGLEAAPSMLTGGGGLIRKGMTWAGSTLGDWLGDEASGGNPIWGMVGALTGAHTPAAIRKFRTPNPRLGTPRWGDVQDVGQDVKLSAGDQVGGLTKRMEGWAGKPEEFGPESYNEQATQGVMRRSGAPQGSFATQGSVQQAQQNIDAATGRLAPSYTPPSTPGYRPGINAPYQATEMRWGGPTPGSVDPDFQAGLNRARSQASHPYPPGSPAAGPPNVVDTSVSGITGGVGGGGPVYGMGGANYQQQRRQLTEAAAAATDPRVRSGLNTLVETLDNQMEKSLSGGPHAGAWPAARGQQESLDAVRALQEAGAAPEGTLNMRRVRTQAPNSPVGKFAEKFGSLTKPLSKAEEYLPEAIGAGLGAANYYYGNDKSGIDPVFGLLAGPTAARMGKAALRSQLFKPGVQSWLANQRWQPGRFTTPDHRTMAKILATQQGIQGFEDTPIGP